jgi:hypothetical protein
MLAMVVRVEWVRRRMIRDSLSAAARKPEKGKLGPFYARKWALFGPVLGLLSCLSSGKL